MLKSDLRIGPNVIIAGQSAPGGGITIGGRPVRIKNNTIIRGIRFRVGDGGGRKGYDGLKFEDGTENVILDHCSFSWGTDEIIAIRTVEPPAFKNITIQWSIIGEGIKLLSLKRVYTQTILTKMESQIAGNGKMI